MIDSANNGDEADRRLSLSKILIRQRLSSFWSRSLVGVVRLWID